MIIDGIDVRAIKSQVNFMLVIGLGSWEIDHTFRGIYSKIYQWEQNHRLHIQNLRED